MNTAKTVEGKTNVRNGVRRMVFIVLSILLEVAFILLIVLRFNRHAEWIELGTRILALVLVLGIYSQYRTATMKMPWLILIASFPLLGVTMYLLIGLNGSTWKMRKRYEDIDAKLLPMLGEQPEAQEKLSAFGHGIAGISSYLQNYAGYPVYGETDVVYYPEASEGLEAQLDAMRSAEHFIFMEYHAIEDAQSWHRIQEVLEDRVRNGVEVRVFYDDMGSIGFINTDFVKRMESVGIRCRVFNPFVPGLRVFLNNRDHRKITVVDGKTGFTGGYNLANEYFNINSPYGYWKDTGIRLQGSAVRSLTATFLEMWNAVRSGDEDDADYGKYLFPEKGDGSNSGAEPVGYGNNSNMESGDTEESAAHGFVQPYADSPLDNEHVGENVYISVAERAQKYAWFVTPYLIITDEMNYALTMAARRGVDVRIITPGIPDKKLIYNVTRSYYARLAQNGVRIFEYTPGFCHCKMSISDDVLATCGTINMDYRSLYHHFENGCLIAADPAIEEMRKDFEAMFAASKEVTEQYRSGRSAWLRFGQLVLRLFAPLM